MTLSPGTTYTPGYVIAKGVMIGLGIALFLLGLSELRTPLRLLITGSRAPAEAYSVAKTKAGTSDMILTDDLQIQDHLEPRNRTYVFWNEFRFQTTEGREVRVRCSVGSQLKPLYPLLDEDGLPTTIPVFYDPKHPETVVFPLLISTWFAPGMLAFCGALCAFIGSFLLYWARKPVLVPSIHAEPPVSPELSNNPKS